MGWITGALLACLAALAAVKAQITEPGICPFSIPLADWDEEQFVAKPWYEIKALAVPGLHSMSPGCTRWHFASSENGQGLHARLAYRTGDGDAETRAFAQYTTSERHPRFNLTFHDLDGSGSARSVHVKLVATDYDDFALLWGCTEPNLIERRVASWVLSRQPYLSENAQEALSRLFRSHDIQADKLVHTNHDQTCGAAAAAVHRGDAIGKGALLEDAMESGTESVLASYLKNAGLGQGQDDLQADQAPSSEDPQQISDISRIFADPDDADDVADVGVSSSYVGSGWLEDVLGAQGVVVAVLLALALVSLIASLLTFRALMARVQRQHSGKPLLPVHGKDIVVATLGSGVDYSRFGNVQTRKGQGQGQDQGQGVNADLTKA